MQQLPDVSPEQVKSKTDFLKFLLNTKRTNEDWFAYGKKIGEFFFSNLDDTNNNPQTDEEAGEVVSSIVSPLSMTFGVLAFLEQDEQNVWELLLMQDALAKESRFIEKSISDFFTEGIVSCFTEKWPHLNLS